MVKKKPENQKQSVYIDTVFLIGYFEKGTMGKDAREVFQKVRKISRNSDIIIKVPLIVLGEFSKVNLGEMSNLLKWNKHCSKCGTPMILNDLFSGHGGIEAEFPSFKKEEYKLAYDLMEKDSQLQAADVLLVACALNDKTGEWLLTTDTFLIGNKVIEDFKEELGSNLKIATRIG
ncbi:hypothetical protein BMS3Bbin16_01254 [archaeon BMS3Bbin16]|nr:hypothetical protein BMS3Bbin16_01254 [archaeon BMS3Bbin16]